MTIATHAEPCQGETLFGMESPCRQTTGTCGDSTSMSIYGDTGVSTHGFRLARQAFYHLSHSTNPFFVMGFLK
jgi:hypothetical protein